MKRTWPPGQSEGPSNALIAPTVSLIAGLQVDQCAPTYFVMGDGGNEEGPESYTLRDAVRVYAV